MRAHRFISNSILASNMRPINVTLDSVTWEYAKEKTNFSAWVRDQLRSERNKREDYEKNRKYICMYCNDVVINHRGYCDRCKVECGLITGDEEE